MSSLVTTHLWRSKLFQAGLKIRDAIKYWHLSPKEALAEALKETQARLNEAVEREEIQQRERLNELERKITAW